MHRHPSFDLWLHDDEELEPLTGEPVAKRATIHEWPLSCVQRVTCPSGATHIYKAQAGPTVEPDFYRCARSPLLLPVQFLPSDHGPAGLLMPDVQTPRLEDLELDEPDALAAVEAVLAGVAAIEGELPALRDIRTPALWLAYGEAAVADLRSLIDADTFRQTTGPMVDQVEACVHSPAVLAALDGPAGYVHQDLWAENVLVVDGGYRIIDWQRPVWGPIALDRFTLVDSLGLDPAAHVSLGARQMHTLLLIGWLAEAACRLFPIGAPLYDPAIVDKIAQLADG